MKRPSFRWPHDASDKLSFLPPGLTGSKLAPLDWEDLADEPEMDSDEMESTEMILSFHLFLLPLREKAQVFLDALKLSDPSRLRKDVIRELAKICNRSEKEIQGLTEQEQARLFALRSHKMKERLAGAVFGMALVEKYLKTCRRLLEAAEAAPGKTSEVFERFKAEIPLTAWFMALNTLEREPDLSTSQRAALQLVQQSLPEGGPMPRLPFTVGEPPQLNALEQHLLEFHLREPAKARVLSAALVQINPARAESWLLFGLTDSPAPAPEDAPSRAWLLAGQLYRWGYSLETADTPFDPEKLGRNFDAIRAIFASPALAAARDLVGEYLLRQLAEAKQLDLLLEVLPRDIYAQNEQNLQPLLVSEATKRADAKEVAHVRALIERFPSLKATCLLPLALRRNAEFDAALAEWRSSDQEAETERALIQARIANASELELPEDPEQQRLLASRLKPFESLAEPVRQEVAYCRVLLDLIGGSRELAMVDFERLELAPIGASKRKAYQLLLALQAQKPEFIERAAAGLTSADAEEAVALMPSNLLRRGIRALALGANLEAVQPVLTMLYSHLPDALDPLLANEELLAQNCTLLQRLLDRTDSVAEPIQRWAGYQRVLELAAALKEPELMARAVDGCLAIHDPLLVPHQVRLLSQRIAECDDLDLRELLVERLLELDPEQAKPFLYQLLHRYMGNHRPHDAWRLLQALRDLGEASSDLDQCARALQPVCQPATLGALPDRSERLARPVSVGFYGGDSSEKARTDQIKAELIRKYPGLTVEFDHGAWNAKNFATLLQGVAKYDVIVASNLMRTDISRAIRQRTRELNKIWGYCRSQGAHSIAESILNAVNLHLARGRQ